MIRSISRTIAIIIAVIIIIAIIAGIYILTLPGRGPATTPSPTTTTPTTTSPSPTTPTSPTTSPTPAPPIKIGAVLPLSEPGAYESGAEMKKALELAVEEINEAGGVLGRRVELVVEDTAGLPEKGTAAMEKLITQDKVVGVVGEFHSSVAVAEIEVAHKYHVPFIVSEAWSDKITAAHYPEVFRIAPANTLFYTKIGKFLADSGFKKVAIIAENTDWGLEVAEIIKNELEKAGAKIIGPYTAERTVTDFTPQILEIKRHNPDLLVDVFTGTGGYLIVKQAYENGLAPSPTCALISMSTSTLYPEFWETTREAGVYVMTKTTMIKGLELSPKTKPFIEKFKSKYGREPTFAAMEAYDSIYVLVEAIKQAGSTDPDAIISTLEKITYTGVLGEISFSTQKEPPMAYHQWLGFHVFVIQYTKTGQSPDDAAIVYPPEFKTSEIQYPSG